MIILDCCSRICHDDDDDTTWGPDSVDDQLAVCAYGYGCDEMTTNPPTSPSMLIVQHAGREYAFESWAELAEYATDRLERSRVSTYDGLPPEYCAFCESALDTGHTTDHCPLAQTCPDCGATPGEPCSFPCMGTI